MTKILLGHRFVQALAAAGIIPDASRVRRVVIDAQVNNVMVMHVELYGDERILDVVPTLEGVEIRQTASAPIVDAERQTPTVDRDNPISVDS